jgi:hypothetical protein
MYNAMPEKLLHEFASLARTTRLPPIHGIGEFI